MKNQVCSDVYKNASEIPVKDVLNQYIKLHERGAYLTGLCPFHEDKHLGSFKISKSTNKWYCNVCGFGGDGADFVGRLENVSSFSASLMICETHNVVPASYSDKVKTRKGEHKESSYNPVRYVAPTLAPIKSREHISAVYEAFCSSAPKLTAAHSLHLKEVRKIPDYYLQDFFEMPNPTDDAFWAKFISLLYEFDGVDLTDSWENILVGVPGFYTCVETGKVTFAAISGIGIKQHSLDGSISALQIRRDTCKDGSARYKMFSSSWANSESKSGNNGSSIGVATDIIFPSELKRLAITEGHFKGIMLARRGYLTLSLNGVTSISGCLDEFITAACGMEMTSVDLYFDADILVNKQVARAAMKIANKLEASGISLNIVSWDSTLGKGVDDVILAGHIKSLTRKPAKPILEKLI